VLDFSIEARTSDPMLTVAIDAEAARIKPGESAILNIVTERLKRRLTGRQEVHRFHVTAVPHHSLGVPKTLTGEFLATPKYTTWNIVDGIALALINRCIVFAAALLVLGDSSPFWWRWWSPLTNAIEVAIVWQLIRPLVRWRRERSERFDPYTTPFENNLKGNGPYYDVPKQKYRWKKEKKRKGAETVEYGNRLG